MTLLTSPLAVVTGASSGIGRELAKGCARRGYQLVLAADEPAIHKVADELKAMGTIAEAVECDLATVAGVDRLCEALKGRAVDALLANAGIGLGKAFLDQDFEGIRKVIDTNVTGTVYLIHRIGRDMRARASGRILITGSIAGFMPGTFQAVYNGTKAFLDSFSYALRNELKDSGVTITCLMPGPTDTRFFERADMMDTKVAASRKDDPAMVAEAGIAAKLQGEGGIVTGWKNKLQVAMAHVTPAEILAARHRSMAEPGSAQR